MIDRASTPRNPLGSVMALIALFHAPVFAAEDNGKTLFADNCAVCHGEYGQVSNNVIPNILGQYSGYLLTQMQAFLSDDPKSARGGVAGDPVNSGGIFTTSFTVSMLIGSTLRNSSITVLS